MDIFSKNDKADNYAQGTLEKGLFTLMFNFIRLLQFVKLNQKQSKYTGVNYGKLIPNQWKTSCLSNMNVELELLNEPLRARKGQVFKCGTYLQGLNQELREDQAKFQKELCFQERLRAQK